MAKQTQIVYIVLMGGVVLNTYNTKERADKYAEFVRARTTSKVIVVDSPVFD